MTLKSKVLTTSAAEKYIENGLDEIFQENKITLENIVRIVTTDGLVIVIWDDGKRPI